MFRLLVWIVATVSLSWVLAFGRVLLGLREREPTVWTAVGLLASLLLCLAAVVLLVYYDYKAAKAKGTVRRTIRLYEEALKVAEARRAERGGPAEPEEPDGK
ncbi:MAG TPA: hypothetical protein VEI97_16630 [bacterium]|nr:hypothetical protein [bacterium]